jgi:Zn finger protein HypA/HybF involved in hydrogenase expression
VTNDSAAFVLKEYIRTNSPCNGMLTALQMAVAALEHSPQIPESVTAPPQVESIDLGAYALACDSCQAITENKRAVLCPKCGAHELKPVYTSDIGRQP